MSNFILGLTVGLAIGGALTWRVNVLWMRAERKWSEMTRQLIDGVSYWRKQAQS